MSSIPATRLEKREEEEEEGGESPKATNVNWREGRKKAKRRGGDGLAGGRDRNKHFRTAQREK